MYTGPVQQLVYTCMVVAAAGLLGACGEVVKNPASDGSVDAPQATVSVTVLSPIGDGLPDPSAKVVFQDPDGAVVSDVAVDAMGHAEAVLPRGGTVSAIRLVVDTAAELSASVTTVLGVKPGDNLTLGLKANATVTTLGGQTQMKATFTPPADGSGKYSFYTPCALSIAGASPATLNFWDSCHGDTFDVLAVTTNAANGTPMFLKESGVKYVSGGMFGINGLFTPMNNFTLILTNIADAVNSASVARASLNGNLPSFRFSVPIGDPPAGSTSVTLPYPQGFGTRSELSITMGRPDAQVPQRHEVHTDSLGPSATVDLGKLPLPWFSDVTQTPTGGTWRMVAGGGAPDGMLTSWSGTWNDGARPISVAWKVVQPADLAGMKLPKLPAAYAMVDPGQQTAAVTPSGMSLYMADYDTVAGYDELRQMPETLLTTTVGTMGAFVGKPFQRRILETTVNVPIR